MTMASAKDPTEDLESDDIVSIVKTMLINAICLRNVVGFDMAIDGLLKLGVGVNWRASERTLGFLGDGWRTPLCLAARLGHHEIVEKLLMNNADSDMRSKDYHGQSTGRTALHEAAQYGHMEAAECLLRNGLQVNDRDAKGWTALHFAILHDQHTMSSKLLDFGADPRMTVSINIRELPAEVRTSISRSFDAHSLGCTVSPNFEWNSSFFAAHCHQHGLLSRLIRDHFKDQLDFQTSTGSTILHEAVNLPKKFNFQDAESVLSHQRTIKLILEHGVDPNIKDANGKTALHVFFDHVNLTIKTIKDSPKIVLDTVRLFLKHKPDLKVVDSKNRTIRHQAAAFGNSAVLNELLAYDNTCAEVDDAGNTTAHVAGYHGNFDCLPLLLKEKGMQKVTNNHGETVFHAILKAKRDENAILEALDLMTGCFDPLTKNLFGETVQDLAEKRSLDRVVKALHDASNVVDGSKALVDFSAKKKEITSHSGDSSGQLVLNFGEEACIRDHLLEHCYQEQLGKIHIDDGAFCHERCDVAKRIIELIQMLFDAVAEDDKRFRCSVVATGSAFEGFRISKPNEFDFMMELTSLSNGECHVSESGNPGFARVRIKEAYTKQWQDMTSSDGYLDSQKLKQHLKRILDAKSSLVPVTPDSVLLFNKTSYDNCQFCQPLFKNSNAGIKMTLLWRGDEYHLMPVDIDLTPAIHIKGWPASAIVPAKHVMGNCERIGYHVIPKSKADDPLLWRFSFSVAELSILHNVSKIQGACYAALKLMKDQTVLFKGKQFSHLGFLHTYILKTKFFEELEKSKDAELWNEDRFLDRVCSVLEAIADHLSQTRKSQVESYFLPGYNVLGEEDHTLAKIGSALVRKSLLQIAARLRGEAVDCTPDDMIVVSLDPKSGTRENAGRKTLLE